MSAPRPPARRIAALVLLAISASVVRAQPAPAGPPTVTFEAPLLFALPDGRPSATPLVAITMNGETALVYLDTGVTHELFSRALARRHGIPTIGRVVGQDHAGAALEMDRLAGVEVRVAGRPVAFDHVAATDLGAGIEAEGVVGIVPPQSLARSGMVVLDAPAGRLFGLAETGEAAVRALAAMGRSVAAVETEAGPHQTLLVRAALDGRVPVWMDLDTGGPATEFTAAYSGIALHAGERLGVRGVSGDVQAGAVSPGHTVWLAGTAFRDAAVHIVAEPGGGGTGGTARGGLLGMDLLRHCVIAVPARGDGPVLLGCTPPRAP